MSTKGYSRVYLQLGYYVDQQAALLTANCPIFQNGILILVSVDIHLIIIRLIELHMRLK